MLKRYLPSDRRGADGLEMGWTSSRYDDARSLIFRLRDTHDRDLPHWRPHAELIDFARRGWTSPISSPRRREGGRSRVARSAAGMATPITPITPVTRIAAFGRAASVTPLTPHREPGADRASRARRAQRCLRRNRGDRRPRSSHEAARCSRRNGRDRTARFFDWPEAQCALASEAAPALAGRGRRRIGAAVHRQSRKSSV